MSFAGNITLKHLIYWLTVSIVLTIFFQQVFVFNVGGSFKIYELISLILCGIFIFIDRPIIYGNLSAVLFVYFVILPLGGLILYYASPLPYDYYQRFPDAVDTLRTNIIVAPLLLLIYYWFTWTVINYVISSKELYEKRDKIIRLFIRVATIVAIYNFYAFVFVKYMGFPDIVPSFLDYRNSPTYSTGRFGGFSDEPGTYIILQTWVVYYLVLGKIDVRHRKLIFIINLVSWLMTLSSLLIPGIAILSMFYLINNKRARIKIILWGAIVSLCSILLIRQYNLESLIRYMAKEKLENYLYGADHTLDSGSFRNFTTRLGFRLFEDHPIFGTGPGTSCFFIWHYEHEMGIKTWGETITKTTYPQNTYSKIAGEMGILGLGVFLVFFLLLLKKEWDRRLSPFMFTSLAGTIFILVAYSTTYPETSLFLWLNIALACNTIQYECSGRFQKHIQTE